MSLRFGECGTAARNGRRLGPFKAAPSCGTHLIHDDNRGHGGHVKDRHGSHVVSACQSRDYVGVTPYAGPGDRNAGPGAGHAAGGWPAARRHGRRGNGSRALSHSGRHRSTAAISRLLSPAVLCPLLLQTSAGNAPRRGDAQFFLPLSTAAPPPGRLVLLCPRPLPHLPLMDVEIDNLTLVLLGVLVVLLLYDRFSGATPLVHPLLLSQQAAPASVRQPNETAVYRAWATGQGTPVSGRAPFAFAALPRGSSDVVCSPPRRKFFTSLLTLFPSLHAAASGPPRRPAQDRRRCGSRADVNPPAR